MFQPGELLVYGTTGVCRVEEITTPDITRADRGRRYYLLKPLYQDGVIYAPVDSDKVPIRPVISREEAEALIANGLTEEETDTLRSLLERVIHNLEEDRNL